MPQPAKTFDGLPADATSKTKAAAHADHLRYRADIDGLRAIAVLSVVGYHAFPDWITGGFIGVDVFFTISGFLITSILLKGLETGNFSFADFYWRRARRILPSLLTVMVACIVVGSFTLFDHEYKELGKHITGGIGFVSNLVLWDESGYFDRAAETKILLHLWSLGIEEQFYIVWPVLLWVLYRFRMTPLWVTLAAGAASFAVGLHYLEVDPTSAFYLPQARFWELLIGALLAYLTLAVGKRRPLVRGVPALLLGNICAVAGALLLWYGFDTITTESEFPGFNALLPTLGTALLIVAGARALPNRFLLGNPVFVWFGKISFVTYLWHWPVLTFLRIINDGPATDEGRLWAVVLTIALSAATHHLIENPLRFGKNRKAIHRGIVVATLATAVAGLAMFWFDGLPIRYRGSPNDLSAREVRESNLPGEGCLDEVSEKPSTFCVKSERPNVALLGDSHALVMFWGFAHSGDKRLDRPAIIGASSCPPALGAEWRPGCDYALQAGLDYIAHTPSVEYVVLAAYKGFMREDTADRAGEFVQGYNRTIKKLQGMGKHVIVAMDNYTLRKESQQCAPSPLSIRTRFKNYPAFCSALTDKDLLTHPDYYKVMERIKAENPGVMFYDPTPWLCPDGKCNLFKDGLIMMGDKDHMSKAGNEFYVRDLIKQLDAR
ncbi:acyltransferase family protein [Cupriavidus sp. 2SB]|uniref:acyltransferase family protein n=1 Tax=Cupriavidus sp. 2SB TaxID=2502199 RepID=UPI0014852B5C|nr:acyltransferase family protein [Cupriavidus sp. 2SB]